MKIGANYIGDGRCDFVVWSPIAELIELKIISPNEKIISMKKDEKGYWKVSAEDVFPGYKYLYKINNDLERPDPASNYQPDGVHSSSQVVNHSAFEWDDESWKGIPLSEMIIYELHIGTFTDDGTFEAAIEKLDHLKELGVTAIEIMPAAQFPGKRNWGYDGVYLFASQNSYGGPDGLKKLVNACHQNNFAVILDVVYNHFGPEGNYISQFGNFFNDKYKTSWGNAINFDDEFSDEVRNFYFQNALYWFDKFHFDALRLDAVHSIYDMSAKHLLSELSGKVDEFSKEKNREFYLIAESDLNDVKVIKFLDSGGYGCDAQWNDDFHHSLHAVLTGETNGYYSDFGKTEHLVSAIKNKFVYADKYSKYRKRNHGNSAEDMPPQKFIIYIQNHDQVGNRAFGERISNLISFEALKLAAGTMLLTPYIPLLFMGEEYGEKNPFLYFVSHSDPDLIKSVREGRKDEFSSFNWQGEIPDPQSVETFNKSKLNWDLLNDEQNKKLFELYKFLIKLRKEHAALKNNDKNNPDRIGIEIYSVDNEKLIILKRESNGKKIFAVMNFNNTVITSYINFPEGSWKKIIDSSDEKWCGSGSSSPENIIGEHQNFTIKQSSFSVYEEE